MNYLVCIKPVPDPACYDRVAIDPVTKTMVRSELPMVINPPDKHALEAALQLREQTGGRVILVGMAPPGAVATIKEGLAMGGDEAYLLSDRLFAGSDTLATARVLAAGIKKIGPYQLVFTGNASADGGTSHVPAQLAVMLGIGHVNNVEQVALNSPKEIIIASRFEKGYVKYRGRPPLVLGVSKKLNTPRYITVPGIMAAQNKKVNLLSARDLDLPEAFTGLEGSPTRPGDLHVPRLGRKSERLEGKPEEIADQLIGIMRAAGVINA